MISFKEVILDPIHFNTRVDQYLSHITLESRELVKQQSHLIRVNKQSIKPSYRLQEGDVVEWQYLPTIAKEYTLVPENIPLDIIFEDEYIIVINKPAGMVVHPAKGNWSGTLANALAYHLKLNESSDLRPGIVHRLDKDTSGLMAIAKTYKAQKNLIKSFQNRKILKIYTAIVQGHLKTSYDTINTPIGRSKKNRLLFAVDPVDGKEAITEYQVVKEFAKFSLLRIRIHTGRTHQIRVHFMSIGHPILGDELYSRSYKTPPLCLASTKLGIIHPITQEPMEFSIEIPQSIKEAINLLQ